MRGTKEHNPSAFVADRFCFVDTAKELVSVLLGLTVAAHLDVVKDDILGVLTHDLRHNARSRD